MPEVGKELHFHIQALKGSSRGLQGNSAWAGLGRDPLGIPAELLLALHSRLVLHPSLHLLEAWRDNLLLRAVAGILPPEEGSLQLREGNRPPGEGSRLLPGGNHHLLPVGSRLALEDSRLLGVGIRLPVGGNLLLQGGSRAVLEGSHLAQEGSRLLGVGMHLVGVGIPLPAVGIHRTEEGILDSSSSEVIGIRHGLQIQEETSGEQRAQRSGGGWVLSIVSVLCSHNLCTAVLRRGDGLMLTQRARDAVATGDSVLSHYTRSHGDTTLLKTLKKGTCEAMALLFAVTQRAVPSGAQLRAPHWHSGFCASCFHCVLPRDRPPPRRSPPRAPQVNTTITPIQPEQGDARRTPRDPENPAGLTVPYPRGAVLHKPT